MRKVLVVEDHPLVAEATSDLLARSFDDVDVVTAGTAWDATARLDDADAAWFRIFLDLAVPGAYGLSLAKHVRDRSLASICCVVSGYNREDYVDELRAWGFLVYVAKSNRVARAGRQEVPSHPGTDPASPPHSRPTGIAHGPSATSPSTNESSKARRSGSAVSRRSFAARSSATARRGTSAAASDTRTDGTATAWCSALT